MTDNSSEMERWHRENGLSKYNSFLELTEGVVFDLGAYDGKWGKHVASNAKLRIFSFEPVLDFFREAKELCKNYTNVRLFNFGLGKKDSLEAMFINKDGSSLFINGNKHETVEIRDFVSFLEEENVQHINLMKINIEGGEYDLLDRIIESGKMEEISDILIQFHSFFPDANKRRKSIREELKKTHYEAFNYSFVWEGWRKK